jgi:hypothetical protein
MISYLAINYFLHNNNCLQFSIKAIYTLLVMVKR